MKEQAYPLYWPEHWPRTKQRPPSKFKTTLVAAIANVEDSLRRFGEDSNQKVTDVVISSNYSLTSRTPADPGVAVYFTWHGEATCIAVDRYPKIEDNLQAIHHCIEAERTKLRHGGLNLVRASFRGYAALPPPSKPAPEDETDHWTKVLGLSTDATLVQAESAYRALLGKVHPDHGGTPEAFRRVRRAWQVAKAQLS